MARGYPLAIFNLYLLVYEKIILFINSGYLLIFH